jgi:uncharacterized membrane protein YczE
VRRLLARAGGRAEYVAPPVLRGGLVARLAGTIIGYALLALGVAVQVQAHAGLAPWDAFHQGVAEQLGWSFGVAVAVVGGAVILLAWALGARPTPFTIANMVAVALLIDLFLRVVPSAEALPLALRLAQMLGGMAVVGTGFALYVAAGLGPGPRDGLMLVVARRSGVRIGITRNAIEAVVLAGGVLLGGAAGVGTVLGVVLVGPASEGGFRLLVLARLARPAAALVA